MHVAPEMASASHVERVPVSTDDLHSSETHIDRFWGEWISCHGESGGDVPPQAGLGAVTGVVLYNGKAIEVDIIPWKTRSLIGGLSSEIWILSFEFKASFQVS